MGRFTRVGAALAALLLCVGLLAGCGGDQQAEADEAMSRANTAMEEWNAADTELFALVEQISTLDVSNQAGIDAALAIVDEIEASLSVSTESLETANAEMSSILDMDVDDEYKTYVQMLIDSNMTDTASDDKGREIVELMREMYAEVAKDAPSEELVGSLADKLETLGTEMDELDLEARGQSEEAEAYFTEQGFTDSAE